MTAKQETRDGEAGTIRDAASPGIFITYGKGNRKEVPRQRGLFERSVRKPSHRAGLSVSCDREDRQGQDT